MSLLGWVRRNPLLTCLLAFWVMCMAIAWSWLAQTLLAVVGLVATARAVRRRQYTQVVLGGDARGIYGDYLPCM